MEKKKFSALPGDMYITWQSLLKSMDINEPICFQNIDSSLHNARQAIKRYYKRMQEGKLPHRRFTTSINRRNHSYTITRIE